ncbi:MAG: diguanylate cyclase [Chloroflexi bacterium]|nr:diguanylate cyclase [Chloroflexota bacterium]
MNELARVVSQFGLEALLEYIHAMVMVVESDGRLVLWNSAFNAVKEKHPEAGTLQEFLPPEEKDDLVCRLAAVCQTGQTNRSHFNLLIDPNGGQLCCDCLLIPISGRQVLFVAEKVVSDPVVSRAVEKLSRQVRLFRIESEYAKKLAMNKHAEVEAVVAQAYEVSNMDPLTFLPNRRQILRELQDEVMRAQRYESMLSISIVDIDHFKMVNDTYGHIVGDQVLREIAIKLRDHTRHPDVVARYGGEEFLILLPNTGLESASEQAARLCKQVRESAICVDSHSIQVTLSIGVAQFQNGVDNWQTLLSRADTAMYDAKHNGRDKWMIAR